MRPGDMIQISLALIAMAGVLISTLNVFVMKRQLDQQKRQWEYSIKPIFRVIRTTKFVKDFQWILIIENTNNVFHQISNVSFSSKEIEVVKITQGGVLEITHNDEKESFRGITLFLDVKTSEFIVGTLKIEGVDLVGNPFQAFSPDIKFKHRDIIDSPEFVHQYFRLV